MEDKKRRGRPPGSRNHPAPAPAKGDHLMDPDTIIARQLAMLGSAQEALRDQLATADIVDSRDIAALEKLSNAIVRSIDALKKSAALTDELEARLTPEQLLEAAIRKLEAQDIAVVNYAIKRLRAHRDRIAPDGVAAKVTETRTATDAIAELTK